MDSPEIGHALEEVCRVLRVAKVDMKCYDAISLEKRKNGNYFLLYEGAEPDENRVYIKRESTDRGLPESCSTSIRRIKSSFSSSSSQSSRFIFTCCMYLFNPVMLLSRIPFSDYDAAQSDQGEGEQGSDTYTG